MRTNAPEGSKGFITVTYSNGEKRRVDVTALAPPAAPAVPPTVVGGTPGEFTGIGGQFTLVMVLEDKDGKPITEALANENFTFKDVTLAPTATPTEVFTTGEAVPVKVENGGKVESGPVSMMIAIDQSGSMSDNDPQRLRYTAATELIDTLKAPDEVGVMSLDTVTQKLTQDYGLAKQAVTRGGGSSDIYGGVRIGVKELASAQHTHKAIVALTDGETGLGNFEASIKEANDARINVYTVGLGNNLNYKELQDLASRTGGAFAHVQNANDLQNVFNAIGRSIQQGGTRVTGQVKLNQGISKVGTYILSGTVVTTVRGQTFETPFSVRVYVDGKSVIALPPVVQSLSPKTGSTKGGVAVVIRGTDLSRVNKVMFGAVPATNFTVNSATQITAITPAQAPGDVQVTVESPEGTSNVSTYTYVNQAPSIGSLRVSKASPLINEEVTFSFSVSDNDGNPTSCVLDFGDGQTQELASCSGNQTVKHTYAAAGSFTAKLTVKDAPGATSTRNVAVRVLATPPNTAPKIASLTANPASPVAGVATAIGFTVSDAENDAVSCVVDFGDGQTQNLTSCAGVQNLSHTYEKEGRYTIKVTAKDAAGSSQQTAVVTVQPKPLNQAPVINAFAATPASPVAGQQVSFSLNVSDPENDAVSCVVDFGDGQTQNLTSCAGDQAIAAIYTVAGTYTATVTATDARGAWSAATVTITVSATPVNTAPLIQTFEVSPVSVNEFEPVTAKWQAIDPDNDAITCTVDFGDGYKTEAMDCSQMTSHVHRYAQAGQYQISVNTTDSRGATAIASSKTIQVMAVTPPVGVTISGVTKDLTPYRDAVYQLDGIKVLQERKTRASLNLNMTTAALYQDGEFEVLNAVDRVPNRNVLAIFKNGVLLEAFLTTWDIEKRDGNDIRITNLRTGKSAYASPNTDSFTAAYREILSESNSNLISRNATSFQSHSIIAQSSSFNCISPTGEAACKSAATELAEKAKGFAEEWGPFAATNYICVGFEVSFIPTVAAGFAINTPTMCAAEMGWSFGKALKNVEAMMGARQELISCMKSNMPTLQTGSRVAAFLTPMPLSTYALIQNEDGMNFGTSTYIMPPSLPINFSLGSQDWPEEYLFIFDKLVSDSVKEKIDDKIAQILFGDIVTEQAAYGLSRAVPNVVEVFETLNDVKVTNITVDGEMQAIILGYCRK